MNRNLLILGAGTYGTVVKEIAIENNCFEKIEFLDDSFGVESENYHEEAIGSINDYTKFAADYSFAIVAIGDSKLRRELTEKLKEVGYTITTLVSPRAYVSVSAQIQSGVVVEPNATIMANAIIEEGSYISAGTVVNHNSYVARYSHIDCNAVVGTGAFVSAGSWVQYGEVVRKKPMKFDVTMDGIVGQPIPVTPVGYNFDEVM